MGAKKHIRMAMIDHDVSMLELAERVGMQHDTFRVKMSRDTMSWSYVEKVADALGCDVVLQDRITKKVY